MGLLYPAQATDDVVWVLSIQWAGVMWRWSSSPVSIAWTEPSGRTSTVAANGGLDALELDRALSGLSTMPDQRSLAIEVLWPDDVAALIAEGHDLATARGELAIAPPGYGWEDRIVILQGYVSQPEYGGDGEPVAFSLVQDPFDDTMQVPPEGARITGDKFPSCADGVRGRYYPIVFGRPGVYVDTDGTTTYTAGSPALAISYAAGVAATLLIAGHRCEATQVRIWYAVDGTVDGAVTSALNIAYAVDDDGVTYAYVDISGEAPDVRGAGAWAAVWSEGPAMISPFVAAGIRTIGELLAWCAVTSSIPCHSAAFVAVGDELTWPVGGFIDEPVSPWEWAQDNILPIVPVSLAVDAEGLYPLLWRHDARRDAAIRTVRAGEGYERASRVRYTRAPRETQNEVRVAWALDCEADEHRCETVLTPQVATSTATSGAEVLATVRQGSTFDSRRSLAAYGEVRAMRIATDIVYDALTAWRIAHWKVRAAATSAREVDYDCGIEVLELDVGDVVILVDAELSLDVVAQVARIQVADRATQTVTFQILDPAETAEPDPPPYGSENTPGYSTGQ